MAGSVSQTFALQQDWTRPDLENTTLMSSKLWKRFSKNTQVKATSDRPARFPSMVSAGGSGSVASLDNGDLGVGNAPRTVFGSLVSTTVTMAWALSKESELATDGNERAIEDFMTLTRSLAPERFADFMDTLSQGDGSNTLDTVEVVNSVAGSVVSVGVTNANLFLPDCNYDVWTALNGTKTATITVSYVEIATNTIFFANPIPVANISDGYLLLASGSSGAPNTGVFGLRYYLVANDSGNWMGLNRSDYPGQFSSQTVAVSGGLTPLAVRTLLKLLELRLGEATTEEGNLFGHCNVDAQVAWEENALLVQNIDYTAQRGDESADMLKRKAPGVIAGYELVVNPRAKVGYLDFLQEDQLSRIEVTPVDFYDVDGQTIFTAYGQSGGIQATSLFYMVWRGQLAHSNPAKEGFISGITAPTGFPPNF